METKISIMMSDNEVEMLTNIVKGLNPDGVIFELGTADGGSAAAMATANPAVKIYTVDLHNNNGESLKDIEYSYQKVKTALSKFKNVTALCGNSLLEFNDWNIEFDLYFEDGAHENPPLVNNLNKWLNFLKPGGLLLMHDNNDYCPDVGKNISILIDSGRFKKIRQVDSLTLLKDTRK